MSVLSPMFATQFKLTKVGELTRRVNFPEPPTWTLLASKIESIYGIPQEQVAVSYVDKDKDEITLNSNDELLDFFLNCHKRGDLVKFNVVDLGSLRAARETATAKVQDTNVGINEHGNAVPSSMLFDDIFGVPPFPAFAQANHAYVEVIEDDDDRMVGNSLQGLFDGNISVEGEEVVDRKSTNSSSASVIENETPHKPLVHVYDLSDIDNNPPSPILLASPRTPKAELRASLHQSSMIPPVMPNLNPFEFIKSPERGNIAISDGNNLPALTDNIGKPLPKTPSTRTQRASMTSTPPPAVVTITESPRAPPVIDSVVGSTPTMQKFGHYTMYDNSPVVNIHPDPVQPSVSNDHNPSLVKDVADLIEVFSSVVSISPDLSNKLRDIVHNAAAGKYWPSDLASAPNATHSVQNTTAESNGQFQHSYNESRTVERDAADRVTAALGRIFGTVREVVKGINDFNSISNEHEDKFERNTPYSRVDEPLLNGSHGGPSNDPAHAPGAWLPTSVNHIRPAPPLIIPPPPIFNGPLMGRSAHIPLEQGFSERFSYLPESNFIQKPSYTGSNAGINILPNIGTTNHPQQGMTYSSSPPMRSAGNPSSYKKIPDIPDLRGDEGQLKSDPHDKKAQLEAAKAYYRAEKERFRKEKEERRKRRRDLEEKRDEESKARKAVEETVVARIPLRKSTEKRTGPFYAEVYSVSRPSQVHDTITRNEHMVQKQIDKGLSKKKLEKAVLARLADMGFRASSHPDMPFIVGAYMRINSELTKENEDNLVTRTMQALLTNDSD